MVAVSWHGLPHGEQLLHVRGKSAWRGRSIQGAGVEIFILTELEPYTPRQYVDLVQERGRRVKMVI